MPVSTTKLRAVRPPCLACEFVDALADEGADLETILHAGQRCGCGGCAAFLVLGPNDAAKFVDVRGVEID